MSLAIVIIIIVVFVVVTAIDRGQTTTKPGGFYEIDSNDSTARALLNDLYFPATNLTAENLELVQLERQIVSGVNYRYIFDLRATSEQCLVVIYYQHWTDTKQVLDDSCGAHTRRKKRMFI
jgi:hypothetical protein